MNNISEVKKDKLTVFISLLVIILGISFFVYLNLITKEKPQGLENAAPPLNININNLNINSNVSETDIKMYEEIRKNNSCITIFDQPVVSPDFSPTDQGENNRTALQFLQNNSVNISSGSEIKNGYLYIRAGTGNPLSVLSQGESVYIYFDGVGGHIFKPESIINVPTNDGLTQYLFKLDKISFTTIPYDDENKSYNTNWLDILNKGGDNYIGAFVSSTKFGKIFEISIAFTGSGNILVNGKNSPCK